MKLAAARRVKTVTSIVFVEVIQAAGHADSMVNESCAKDLMLQAQH
jgi:hypothetical protein